MTFDPLKEPIDYILLTGVKSPGLADVEGAESLRAWAIRQPPFSTGARLVYMRRELAKFSVRFRLYTSQDHVDWGEFRKILDAVPGVRTAPKGLEIVHPLLVDLNIRAVLVESISQGVQTGDGEWTYTVKFIEWRDLPVPSAAKIEGTQAAPIDPIDQHILNNQKRMEDLAQQLGNPPPIPRIPQ